MSAGPFPQQPPTYLTPASSQPGRPWTGNSAAATQVPAFGGTYVLAIGPNAQRLPVWSDLALDQTRRNDPRSVQLVTRGGSRVSFPYFIFGVQQTAA